jgi:hypothetical protein
MELLGVNGTDQQRTESIQKMSWLQTVFNFDFSGIIGNQIIQICDSVTM